MNALGSLLTRSLMAIAFTLAFLPGLAQAEVELVINFSGAPTTTGGAIYAQVGDAEPISCSITNGADTWTCDDNVFSPWNTVWSGPNVTAIGPEIEKGPGCFLSIVDFNATYNAGGQQECNEASPGLGSYTLTSTLITDVPALTPLGLGALSVSLAGVACRRFRRESRA